jgi:hypothetical protein
MSTPEMTKRDLAELVLKMVGVYVLLQAVLLLRDFLPCLHMLKHLGFRVSSSFFPPIRAPRIYIAGAGPFVITLITGLVLVCFGRTLAGVLARTRHDVEERLPLRAEDALAIAFSAVALLVGIAVLPRIGILLDGYWSRLPRLFPRQNLAQYRVFWTKAMLVQWRPQERVVMQSAVIAVQLGFALLLFVGARRLASMVACSNCVCRPGNQNSDDLPPVAPDPLAGVKNNSTPR